MDMESFGKGVPDGAAVSEMARNVASVRFRLARYIRETVGGTNPLGRRSIFQSPSLSAHDATHCLRVQSRFQNDMCKMCRCVVATFGRR